MVSYRGRGSTVLLLYRVREEWKFKFKDIPILNNQNLFEPIGDPGSTVLLLYRVREEWKVKDSGFYQICSIFFCCRDFPDLLDCFFLRWFRDFPVLHVASRFTEAIQVLPALLLRFLREHLSEWADNNIDAYSAAAVKLGPTSIPTSLFGGVTVNY
ncbi:hypothetical protein L6452_34604 [Arctium lappa]|uniref:Uncharacterized protein n=3 Tax=Arctium lappa TaxID=4217 RepID=A0ACB8YJD9_ARCLA|nr:hypothetical protein L6452_34582 [Arctium lappa]KAI3685351.1 hypothetical protein L6452_34593 [Arctium lappa]KAI3685362.1 hypothetical protein L6452_34604 [Arctium lappa]